MNPQIEVSPAGGANGPRTARRESTMRTRWNQNRESFTLVELMVVVVILGILAALITTAAMSALVAAREASIKFEVDSLAMALNNYKTEFGDFPPDFSDPNLVEIHLRNRWPRINQTEINTIKALPLTRAQALVFWLRGFSGSPNYPYSAGGQRVAMFDFDKTRLLDPATKSVPTNATVVPVYISNSAGRSAAGILLPYIYFEASTYANSNAKYAGPSGARLPYRSDLTTDVYAAPDSFQLIHAGLDEDYGNSTAASYPSGNNYTWADRDNIVNFLKAGRTLSDSIP
jgi:prepilin-type N-terminal cleavage/methylation domain-containing protein